MATPSPRCQVSLAPSLRTFLLALGTLLSFFLHAELPTSFTGAVAATWEQPVGTSTLVYSITRGTTSTFSHGDTRIDLGNGQFLDAGVANVLSAKGASFASVPLSQPFKLADVSITNGTTFNDSEASKVTLKLTLAMSNPAQTVTFMAPLRLIGTDNSSNQLASADIVELQSPAIASDQDGVRYNLDLAWATMNPASGVVQGSQFLTFEGATATAELRGRLSVVDLKAPFRSALNHQDRSVAHLSALASGRGVMVAIFDENSPMSGTYSSYYLRRSTDGGQTWATISPTPVPQARDIAFGNGTFVASGSGMAVSVPDANGELGKVWQSLNLGLAINGGFVFFADGKFRLFTYYLADGVSEIAESSDGVHWAKVGQTPLAPVAMAFGNGRYATTTSDLRTSTSRYIISSTGPGPWTTTDLSGRFGATATGIAFGSGRFVVTLTDGRASTSTDGITWTDAVSVGAGSLNGLSYSDGLFVVGLVSKSYQISGGSGLPTVTSAAQTQLFTSEDGVNWSGRVGLQKGFSVSKIISIPAGATVIGRGKASAYDKAIVSYFSDASSHPAPTITTQPGDLTVARGASTTFVVVTPDIPASFQWYRGNSGDTSSPVAGATQASFRLTVTQADKYWVRITNENGSTDSRAAQLSLATNPVPVITTQPTNISGSAEGTPVYVGATSDRGLSVGTTWFVGTPGNYRPYASGNPVWMVVLPGQYFWVRFTDASGSTDSRVASMTATDAPSLPVITTQLANVSASAGSLASLFVGATGTALHYQWYEGVRGNTATPVANSDNATLTIPSARRTSYWVRVSNSYDSIDSATAYLIVGSTGLAPVFTSQPADAQGYPSSSAALSVTTDDPLTTFQWFDGSSVSTSPPVPGATASTLNISITQNKFYWVRASNEYGSTNSRIASVTLQPWPTPLITAQPSDQHNFANAQVTLSVTASDPRPLSYQWYSGISGDVANPITNANQSSITLAVQQFSPKFYWVSVTNGHQSVESRTVTVTTDYPISPPYIWSEPLDVYADPGATAVFTVAHTATGQFTVQWYRGSKGDTSSPIAGANSTTLALTIGTEPQQVWVRIANSAGRAESRTVIASRYPDTATIEIASHYYDGWLSPFGEKLLRVRESFGPSATFQWFRDDVAVADVRSSTLTLRPLLPTLTGRYTARITVGSRVWNSAPIDICYLNSAPAPVTQQEGLQATLHTEAIGPGLQYQWLNSLGQPLTESTHFTGTQTATLTINQVTPFDGGIYLCRVNSGAEQDTVTHGFSVRGKPLLAITSNAVWRIGQPVDATIGSLSADNPFTVASVTGLPPGVRLANGTQLIGKPTAAGNFIVKIQARNEFGLGPVSNTEIKVFAIPDIQIGIFNGLVERDDAINGGLGGRFTLTTTALGTFTGVVTTGSVSRSFKGTVTWDGSESLSGNAVLATSRGIVVLSLDFYIDGSGQLNGNLYGPTSNISLHAVHSPWRNGVRAVQYAGTNIVALPIDPALEGNAQYPQGVGYFGGNVTLDGVLTAAARFADNTIATIAVTIGQDSTLPFYWPLYNSTGSVHGWGRSDGNTVDGDVSWSKRAQTTATRSYKAGFPVHRLQLKGGRMKTYSPGQLVLGWPISENNASATLDSIGTSSSIVQNFSLFTNPVVFMPTGSPLSLSVSRDQNKFTGSIKDQARIGTCYGVFVDQLGYGIGHVQIPVTTARDAPILSGRIRIDNHR